MESINKRSYMQKLKAYKRNPISLVLSLLVMLSTILTIGILLFLIGYIMIKGIPNIKPELFQWEYNTLNVSLMPALINTVYHDAHFAADCSTYRSFFCYLSG